MERVVWELQPWSQGGHGYRLGGVTVTINYFIAMYCICEIFVDNWDVFMLSLWHEAGDEPNTGGIMKKSQLKEWLATKGWSERRYWEIVVGKRFDVRDIIETTGKRLRRYLIKK